MWAVGLRILAGLGIGELLDFFSPEKPTNESDLFSGITKVLILLFIPLTVIIFLLWKKRK